MVASVGPASDGEALAALGPAALERLTPGLREHALAKPVAASTLALLGLVGALHGERRVGDAAAHPSAPGLPDTVGGFSRDVRAVRAGRPGNCPGRPPVAGIFAAAGRLRR